MATQLFKIEYAQYIFQILKTSKLQNFKLIKVLLTGGLGNQMFQYAFGKTLAVKNNTELILLTSYLQSKLPFKKFATQMQYELSIFNVQAKIESNFFANKMLYPLAKSEHILREQLNNSTLNVVKETQFNFQTSLLNTPDNSFIKGNFQSEKYFKSIESILRNNFTFNTNLDSKNIEWQNKIENSNSVSIHIRRGDYISIKSNAQKFAQIPISYYQNAIHHISSK